jgi:hypothetical protein
MGNVRASLRERRPISVASLQSSSARGVQAATLPACRPPHDATHRPRSLRLLAHASCLNTALALMVPQKPNQCRQTRSSTNPWESPRFHPTEICSKSAKNNEIDHAAGYRISIENKSGVAGLDRGSVAALEAARSATSAWLTNRTGRSAPHRTGVAAVAFPWPSPGFRVTTCADWAPISWAMAG